VNNPGYHATPLHRPAGRLGQGSPYSRRRPRTGSAPEGALDCWSAAVAGRRSAAPWADRQLQRRTRWVSSERKPPTARRWPSRRWSSPIRPAPAQSRRATAIRGTPSPSFSRWARRGPRSHPGSTHRGNHHRGTGYLRRPRRHLHADGPRQRHLGHHHHHHREFDQVAGSFDVTFDTGDHLTGTFSAPVCDASLTDDGGTSACGS
jgi:hypothetical protein